MKSIAKQLLLGLLLCAFGMVTTTGASTIILSGDSNIGYYIANPGNATFFGNVLGGGTNVLLQNENTGSSVTTSINNINNYYKSLSGVTSDLYTGTITPASLAGVDLFFSILPKDSYLASEVTALSSFLSGDGTLFLFGEGNVFSDQNARLNTLLASLGSNMSLGTVGYQSSSWATNIVSDPFTAGVTSFQFGYTNSVLDGNPLFLTYAANPFAFVAYESVGAISAPVPEPATMLLLGTGLVGVAGAARRRKKNQG
jgi:hypothetical protein